MELYRYLVDDFVIQFSQGLKEKDFMMKAERTTRKRWDIREYLNGSKTRELNRGFDGMFEGCVEVPRIKHGPRQSLKTLINEEAYFWHSTLETKGLLGFLELYNI